MSKTRLLKNNPWLIILLSFLTLIYILVYFEAQNPSSNISSYSDGLWYAIVTLTTVGYGDMYPITSPGKIIGLVLVLGSVGIIGFLIGNVSNKINSIMEKRRLGLLGTEFKNHIVIIGWDDFGRQVSDQIVKAKNRVAIVTDDKHDIDLISDLYTKEYVFTLFADYNNLEALRNVNIQQASTVFLNLKDDTEILVYLLNLKKEYQDLEVVVSLNNPNLKETFHTAGVTYAISKNEIASKLVASFIFEPDVAQLTEDIMSTAIDEFDFDLLEFKITEDNMLVGKDCHYVFDYMKKKYDTVLLGLSKRVENGWKLIKNPPSNITISPNDYLIVMSNGVIKAEIERDFGVEEGKLHK